jgi:hypothetical protein
MRVITCECVRCGTWFSVQDLLKVRRYCTKECQSSARRLPVTKALYRTRYLTVGHPLNSGSNKILAHRLALWEKIGPGPHPCHYCGVLVDWILSADTRKGALISEHVDRDPANNDQDNLVPSCQRCNILNSRRRVLPDEPHRISTRGTRRRCVVRSCRHCSEEFLAYRSKDPTRGVYCSRSCIAKDKPRRRRERAA